MKLITISFAENGEGDPYPDRVTVEMSKDEALILALLVGMTNDLDRNAMMPGGGALGSDIYDCLVGSVFNRYWEDGVKDALRER